jgi:hypothetical protein
MRDLMVNDVGSPELLRVALYQVGFDAFVLLKYYGARFRCVPAGDRTEFLDISAALRD